MYRYLAILLVAAASSAPQLPQGNSDITYVKIQPLTNQRVSKLPYRESRIENLPLTIPGPTNTGFKINRDFGKVDTSLENTELIIDDPVEKSEFKVDTSHKRDRGLVKKDVKTHVDSSFKTSELNFDSPLEITKTKERLNENLDDPKKGHGNDGEWLSIQKPKRDTVNEKFDEARAGKRFSRNSKDGLMDLQPAKALDLIVDHNNEKNEKEFTNDSTKEKTKEIIKSSFTRERNLDPKPTDNLELKTDILSKHSNKYEINKDISESNLSKRSPVNPSEDEEKEILSASSSLVTPEIQNNAKDISDLETVDSISHLTQQTTIYDDLTDTTESVTDHKESLEQLFKAKDQYESQTNAPNPRFVSKLSYFRKNEEESSVVTNFIERASKRKFKSKCRCEKIWNCPKLQITVPRCPNEYFLCCF